MTESVWLRLSLLFVPLSLISVGGNSTILAELRHQTVDTYGWLTVPEFIGIYALCQISPGPGTLIATLIGWNVGGWIGALIATLAYGLPSSLLFYGLVVFLHDRRASIWKLRIEQGLVPVAVGLIIAGSSDVLISANHNLVLLATAAVSVAILLWTSVNPLLIIFVAASTFALSFIWA